MRPNPTRDRWIVRGRRRLGPHGVELGRTQASSSTPRTTTTPTIVDATTRERRRRCRSWRRPCAATSQTTSAITTAASAIRHRLRDTRPQWRTRAPCTQHLQRPHRGEQVGHPERQAEAEHAPTGRRSTRASTMLITFSTSVDEERCAGVLVGIERAQHEQVDARSRPGRGRSRPERAAGVRARWPRELAVLQDRPDDRLGAARTARARRGT